MRYCGALFNRVISFILFCLGLCSHTVLFFCRIRGGRTSVEFSQDGGDRVDLSPRDHQITTRGKKRISERDQPAYLMTGGSVGSVRFSSHGPIFFSLWTARDRADKNIKCGYKHLGIARI